jgi:hypothetical protein
LREAVCRTHAWFSGNTISEREISKLEVAARGTHA